MRLLTLRHHTAHPDRYSPDAKQRRERAQIVECPSTNVSRSLFGKGYSGGTTASSSEERACYIFNRHLSSVIAEAQENGIRGGGARNFFTILKPILITDIKI